MPAKRKRAKASRPRRVYRRRMVGGAPLLSTVNQVLKETGLASNVLDKLGFQGLSGAAKTLGYGKRRRPGRPRRRMRGAGFGDFLASSLAGLGTGLGRGASGLLGSLFGGRKKRMRGGFNTAVYRNTGLVGRGENLLSY